jgi:hypothetical protein
MTTEQLTGTIKTVISDSKEMDWLIIRRLAVLLPDAEKDRFSFIDKEEKIDEAFQFQQGWMKLNEDEVKAFKKLLQELVLQNRDNLVRLANLFVLQSRIGSNFSERDELADLFKDTIGVELLSTLYGVLMASLNEMFFVHTSLDRQVPVDAKDWLRLFHWSAMRGSSHELLVGVVFLIADDIQNGVDLRYIRQMKPSIRAVLCDFWGMGIVIDKDELRTLIKEGEELPYLAAYLVHRSRGKQKWPKWVTMDLIEGLFVDWKRTGSFLVEQVLGGRQGTGVSDENEVHLEQLINTAVSERLKRESTTVTDWILGLVFPLDFIGVFACVGGDKLTYGEVAQANKKQLFTRIIQQLWQIFSEISIFVDENEEQRGPSDWPLGDPKFRHLMAVLLLLYLDVGEKESRKKFKSICFETKLLFYGAYRTSSLARKLAEMLLVTSLSAKELSSLPDELTPILDRLLADIVDTILVPFVHTIEREEQIWNPELESVIGNRRFL